jgi:hypothetical protein
MKFDALVFDAWWTGLKVEQALAEIAAHVGPRALLVPAAKLTDFGYADRKSADIDSIRRMLATCLSERACHALPWYGHTLVVAHAGQFRPFLDDLAGRHASNLVSRYHDGDTDVLPFRVANFGDYGGESEVCWKFARGDCSSVLVLCDFTEDPGEWWRPVTAFAEPLRVRAKHHGSHYYGLQVVYRVHSEQVLTQLWSRTSHNDAIAYACAPEGADLDELLATATDFDDSSLIDFARHNSWIYKQRYGGGAGEHYARFACGDPQLLERVYRHAAQRARSDSGWWLIGML